MRSKTSMKEKGVIRNQRVTPEKIERSRVLRREMTEAEKVFWNMVRDRKMFGLKFRRQQIIDGFIVDFYCDSLGLCIEIDGGVHDSDEQARYDRERDEVLALRGLKVLRLANEDVINDVGAVRELVKGFVGNGFGKVRE